MTRRGIYSCSPFNNLCISRLEGSCEIEDSLWMASRSYPIFEEFSWHIAPRERGSLIFRDSFSRVQILPSLSFGAQVRGRASTGPRKYGRLRLLWLWWLEKVVFRAPLLSCICSRRARRRQPQEALRYLYMLASRCAGRASRTWPGSFHADSRVLMSQWMNILRQVPAPT